MKDFGGLAANTVYIRRGDTTDIAAPGEIYHMGAASLHVQTQPALDLEFASLEDLERLGRTIEIQCNHALVPNEKTIPDYRQTIMMENRDYYREIADWVHATMHLQPIGLVIESSSTTVAEDVIVTLELDAEGISMYGEDNLPSQPSPHVIVPRDIKGPPLKERIDLTLFERFYEAKAYFGTVQPGTTKWSTMPFYIGARQSCSAEVRVTISANNLRTPISLAASISIDARPREISNSDIAGFGR